MPIRLRSHLKQLTPYSPGRPIEEVRRELGLEKIVKLASNENPLGPSPKAIRAAEVAAATGHLYPDAAAFELRSVFAKVHGLEKDQIMLGNGSDEIIHFLGLMMLDSEADEVVVGKPSFVRYNAAGQLANCKVIEVPVNSNLQLDLGAMAEQITDRTRMVWVANPNNPTGTFVSKSEVDLLLKKLPDGAALILDEAYAEFAEHEAEYPRSIDYIKDGAPVIGLRTMSKAYGLAGFRIGYGFASPEIVDVYNRVREPFNVSHIAQAAALAALEDQEHLRKSVAHNSKAIQRIGEIFEPHGAVAFPSYANFVLIKLGENADAPFRALMERGVIVRSGTVLGLPDFLRVSVGTDDELDFLEAGLNDWMSTREPFQASRDSDPLKAKPYEATARTTSGHRG